MELTLALYIYLVGVITGTLIAIAIAIFSDRRIKIEPTEDGGQYL